MLLLRASVIAALSLLALAVTAYAEDSDIESEPIPLDSQDLRYSGYLGRVSQMIKARWRYPCVENETTRRCEYKSARLSVIFAIAKDGRVARVEVQESSGYGIYDEYAVNAVSLASPFPPVPPELMATAKPGSAGVRILAAFRYVLVDGPRSSGPRSSEGPGSEGPQSYYHARRAYFDQVRKRVEVNLETPCVVEGVACEYKVTDVSVEFSVAKDGRVGLVVVRSPSPWPIYNEYSVRAIRVASPFPSIPDEGGFSIRMTFKYTTGRPPALLVE